MQVGQLAIGLAGLRGGIIGVYGDLFVNIWHRMKAFVVFGIIDGAVTSGVGLALTIFETGTLGEKRSSALNCGLFYLRIQSSPCQSI